MRITSTFFTACFLLQGAFPQQTDNAKAIIAKSYSIMQGESNWCKMTMTIVRPSWQRTISFTTWSKGSDYSMALITNPAKEKGQTFLKRNNEIWNWVPSIQRLVKLPPAMMSQGWMGSDFSNDDLLKETSITRDYSHRLLSTETIDGYECYKIELLPLEEASVVWGKLIKWVDKQHYLQLRTEYYDEDFILVKTEKAGDIKVVDGRTIPTRFEIIPADNNTNKTRVVINDMKFDVPLSTDFFSQQNMKKLR